MRRLGFSLVTAALAASIACSDPEPAEDPELTSGAAETGPGGDASGLPASAPDLVLAKLDGSGDMALADQRGKVVLVDLWATWCVPCIAELPHLQELSERFPADDFLMLGIVLESGDAEEIRQFVEDKDVDYPQLVGEEDTNEAFGPFLGYPTKYLIARDGRIAKRYFGIVGEELADDVEELITTGALAEADE